MKEKFYEMIFEVTETCNNGNERTKKVSVYSPIFRNGKHVIELDRINKAVKTLEEAHFYNIKYVDTKTASMFFTA